MRKIRVFDTTLRDGEQSARVGLNPEHKLLIARQLDALGVDAIEAGFPATSPGDRKAIRDIVDAGLNAEIWALARTDKRDVDDVVETGVKHVHVFISTSDIHLEKKLRITHKEAVEKTEQYVSYAKSQGVTVEFSAEDATRTNLEFLKLIYKTAVDAGADRINIPDTVGYATGDSIRAIVQDVMSVVTVPISVHCHNDLGQATANTLAAVHAGAQSVHVTINGVGERAGNASLEEVAASIVVQYPDLYKTGINTRLIGETSRMIAELFKMPVQANKAIVGDNAFAHESGIHVAGVLAHPGTYEIMDPGEYGMKRDIALGKHSGIAGVIDACDKAGIPVTKEQGRKILKEIKQMADDEVVITELDLRSIIANVFRNEEIRV